MHQWTKLCVGVFIESLGLQLFFRGLGTSDMGGSMIPIATDC